MIQRRKKQAWGYEEDVVPSSCKLPTPDDKQKLCFSEQTANKPTCAHIRNMHEALAKLAILQEESNIIRQVRWVPAAGNGRRLASRCQRIGWLPNEVFLHHMTPS